MAGLFELRAMFSMRTLFAAGAKTKELCPVQKANHWSAMLDEGMVACVSRYFSGR